MFKIGSEDFVNINHIQHKTGVNQEFISLLNALHATQI